MTAKEYLGQAYRLDQRIDSKLLQVESLDSMAKKATATLSDMPGSATRNIHSREDIIVKIIDLKHEVNRDIDYLVDLKTDITRKIRAVDNLEYQTLLELRYLNYKTWEQIAVEMGYTIHHLYKMHNKALACVRLENCVKLPEEDT